MSDTPRTDGQEKSWREWPIKGNPITADFARQLERELAEARAEIERLKEALGEALGVLPKGYKEHEKCGAALEAAERTAK